MLLIGKQRNLLIVLDKEKYLSIDDWYEQKTRIATLFQCLLFGQVRFGFLFTE